MATKKKLIIWGYPLYSDTFSYVWYGFYRAAIICDQIEDVYWFDDGHLPKHDFDYSDSIILCEGYKMENLPLRKDCTYFIHCPQNKNIRVCFYLTKFLSQQNVHLKTHDLDQKVLEYSNKKCLLICKHYMNYPYRYR